MGNLRILTKPGGEVCEHQRQVELQRKQIQQTSVEATEHQIAVEVTLLRLCHRALSLLSLSPIARCTPSMTRRLSPYALGVPLALRNPLPIISTLTRRFLLASLSSIRCQQQESWASLSVPIADPSLTV